MFLRIYHRMFLICSCHISFGGLSDWMFKKLFHTCSYKNVNMIMTANICSMKTIFLLFSQHFLWNIQVMPMQMSKCFHKHKPIIIWENSEKPNIESNSVFCMSPLRGKTSILVILRFQSYYNKLQMSLNTQWQ